MSGTFDLAATASAVRTQASVDAGASVLLAAQAAASELARHLDAPAGRYGVSVDGVRVSGAWRDAERILVIPARAAGESMLIAVLQAGSARLAISPEEPDFGLHGAEEGLLPAGSRPVGTGSLTRPARLVETGLACHALISEGLHLATVQGVLDGFVDRAIGFLQTRSSPWYGAGLARATDDPHALRALGQLISRRNALDALAADAVAALAVALDGHETPTAPAELAVARHYAKRLARSLVTEGIGLLGASSASGRHGFDRFWRDVATHELRFPPLRDAEALGRDFIESTRAAP